MTYRFQAGEHVLVVNRGEPVRVDSVARADAHFATLSDGSVWYHAGFPLSGSTDLRITPLTDDARRAFEYRGRLARLAELATIVLEVSERTGRVPHADLEQAERLLFDLVLRHVGADGRNRVWERLRAAESRGRVRPLAR